MARMERRPTTVVGPKQPDAEVDHRSRPSPLRPLTEERVAKTFAKDGAIETKFGSYVKETLQF